MIDTARHIDLSYYSFLDELELLLQNTGIFSSRQRILAEANREKNWRHRLRKSIPHKSDGLSFIWKNTWPNR